MSAFWQDVRYAARSLRHAPGFTCVAAVVLALGIGANSDIFSLADAILLRPLPFAVTAAFFDVLGIRPIAGRTFAAEDITPQPTVVVIGEQFWRSRFGGDPALVGRTIALDGQPLPSSASCRRVFRCLHAPAAALRQD